MARVAAGGRGAAPQASGMIPQLGATFLLLLWMPFFLKSTNANAVQELLALKAGNSWSYQGTVKWTTVATAAHPSVVREKEITWKTEVQEESAHGQLKAYLLHGSVDDLLGYDPDNRPAYYLWIVYQDRLFTLQAAPDIIRRFHDSNDPLTDLVGTSEPVMQLPMELGKCTTPLHPKEKRERDDLFYCWHFEQAEPQVLHIRGVPSQTSPQWDVAYRTMPDHQIWHISPGIGITAYDYSHHGTVSESHVKLVEAHLQ